MERSFQEKRDVVLNLSSHTVLSIGLPQITFYILDGQYYALCPFHQDKRLGSFSYNPNSNIWKCFACGEGGMGAVSLVMKVNEWKFKQAIEYLYEHRNDTTVPFGAPPLKLRSRASSTVGFKSGVSSTLRKKKPSSEYAKFAAEGEVSEQDLDIIYRCFAKASPLSEATISQLKATRGLYFSSTNQFFQFPNPENQEFWEKFRSNLRNNAAGTDRLWYQLLNVPGFMWDKEEERVTFGKFGEALGILNCNERGFVIGIELRLKTPLFKGNRYMMFSAKGICSRNPERFEKGKGSPLTADHVPPAHWRKTCKGIAITEGKFKALHLSYWGYYALNIHSVQNWRCVIPFIAAADPSLPIISALDADCYCNDAVAKCAISLGEAIQNLGRKCYYLKWPLQYGKGIDDALIAGAKPHIRCIAAEKFMQKLRGAMNA